MRLFIGHKQIQIAIVVEIGPVGGAAREGFIQPVDTHPFKIIVALVAVQQIAFVARAVGDVNVHQPVVVVIAKSCRFGIGAHIARDALGNVRETTLAIVEVKQIGAAVPGRHVGIEIAVVVGIGKSGPIGRTHVQSNRVGGNGLKVAFSEVKKQVIVLPSF